MRIRPARASDEQALRRLLETSDLVTSDLPAESASVFLVAEVSGRIEGVVGLETENGVGLLRSLATSTAVRGRGIAGDLVAAAEARARAMGVGTLWLLTTTATEFFERLGYRHSGRRDAPAFIRNTRQFRELCPASASLLEKSL